MKHTDTPTHPWTQRLWESLPQAYQDVDALQNQELGGYPLLRWLDGIGQLGGKMRTISDNLYDGVYTNPATTPDHALPWLAMLLGMSDSQRRQPPALLRERLVTLTTVGRSAVGSRAMIGESAKPFLAPGAQVRVRPSDTRPHVIILYIRAFDIPDDNIARVLAEVREAGFIPAGHLLDIVPVQTTWDAWEAAAGATWAEKEANIKTWNDSDSAGVVLE